MIIKIISVIFSVTCLVAFSSGVYAVDAPHQFKSYAEAIKLAPEVYQDHQTTFFCGCNYNDAKKVDLKTCKYKPRKKTNHVKHIQWGHVQTPEQFGQSRQCWKNPSDFSECKKWFGYKKGKDCCRIADPLYSAMEADLHNIVPMLAELNKDLQKRTYNIIPGEPRKYGQCDFEADVDIDIVEPKRAVRGDIARIYLYMEQTYGIPISRKRRQLFDVWNQSDPVDEWEKTRNQRLEKIQGNLNSFVK